MAVIGNQSHMGDSINCRSHLQHNDSEGIFVGITYLNGKFFHTLQLSA